MIADNRKSRDKKRKRHLPEPKPCWAQAFMIMLLHENAMLKQKLSSKPEIAQITMKLAHLKRFEALKGDNKTKLDFNKVAETVTITAPEMVLPEKPVIIHEKGIKLN